MTRRNEKLAIAFIVLTIAWMIARRPGARNEAPPVPPADGMPIAELAAPPAPSAPTSDLARGEPLTGSARPSSLATPRSASQADPSALPSPLPTRLPGPPPIDQRIPLPMLSALIEARIRELRESKMEPGAREAMIRGYEGYLKSLDEKSVVGIHDFLRELPAEEKKRMVPALSLDLAIERRRAREKADAKQ